MVMDSSSFTDGPSCTSESLHPNTITRYARGVYQLPSRTETASPARTPPLSAGDVPHFQPDLTLRAEIKQFTDVDMSRGVTYYYPIKFGSCSAATPRSFAYAPRGALQHPTRRTGLNQKKSSRFAVCPSCIEGTRNVFSAN